MIKAAGMVMGKIGYSSQDFFTWVDGHPFQIDRAFKHSTDDCGMEAAITEKRPRTERFAHQGNWLAWEPLAAKCVKCFNVSRQRIEVCVSLIRIKSPGS